MQGTSWAELHRGLRRGAFLGNFGCLFLAVAWSAAAAFPEQPRSAVANRSSDGVARTYDAGQVNLESSRVFIHVFKTGFGHEHAVVGRLKSGRLDLNAARDPGELVFDMPTFDADSELARKYLGLQGATDEATRQQVNANLRGADVLDVGRFPTATYRIESVQQLEAPARGGLPRYELSGQLVLHGVTRPLRFVAVAEDKGGWLHLRGRFSLLQSEFGMKPFSKAFGAVGVADKLDIVGDLWLAREQLVVRSPGTGNR